MEFESAMKAHKILKNACSTTGVLCASIISALDNQKEAIETATALSEFWKNVPDFETYVLFQAVEGRVSRALLMLSCCKAYQWVTSITTAAVKYRTNQNCWVYQLVKDVETEWSYRNCDSQHPREATFHSQTYLPSLASPSEAKVILRRLGMREDDQKELKLIQTVSSIIETWLQFPTSKDNKQNDKVRCSIISIITTYMPHSVLLLDAVWAMFVKPYQLLIHGRPKQRISSPHTATTLKLFDKTIRKHCLIDSSSIEHRLLAVLTEQMESWFRLISSKVGTENVQTAPIYHNVSYDPHKYWMIFILNLHFS